MTEAETVIVLVIVAGIETVTVAVTVTVMKLVVARAGEQMLHFDLLCRSGEYLQLNLHSRVLVESLQGWEQWEVLQR